jgi:hypothetical protein
VTLSRRVAAVETSLSPTGLVLVWLSEAHSFGNVESYVASLIAQEPPMSPLDRLGRQAGRGARNATHGKRPEVALAAVRSSLRETVFRFELVVRINVSAHELLERESLIDAALAAQITLLVATEARDATTVEGLATRRDLALVRVSELRAAQEARSIVEGRYLDGHGALFPYATQAWDEHAGAARPSPTRWSASSNSTVCPLQLRATPRPCSAGPPSLWPTLWSRPRPPPSTSSTRVSGRSASLPGGYGQRWRLPTAATPSPSVVSGYGDPARPHFSEAASAAMSRAKASATLSAVRVGSRSNMISRSSC